MAMVECPGCAALAMAVPSVSFPKSLPVPSGHFRSLSLWSLLLRLGGGSPFAMLGA